jgi:hypothetical protein
MFGILWLRILVASVLMLPPSPSKGTSFLKAEESVSAFPILMYDADIGLGYGARAKFVDYINRKDINEPGVQISFVEAARGECLC